MIKSFILSLSLLFFFLSSAEAHQSLLNKYDNGFPEEKYQIILDEFQKVYDPIITDLGGTFEIIDDWSDGAVNMWAEKWGERYILEIPGGMARYGLIIEEAFILSICHELGHLLGGSPQLGEISLEGQSDFYAGQVCIEKMLEQIKPLLSIDFDDDVTRACEEQKSSKTNHCLRAMQGAKSLTSYYAELEGVRFPTFDTPSTFITKATLESHPSAQCRLDTFKNGYFRKLRPRCWFKP